MSQQLTEDNFDSKKNEDDPSNKEPSDDSKAREKRQRRAERQIYRPGAWKAARVASEGSNTKSSPVSDSHEPKLSLDNKKQKSFEKNTDKNYSNTCEKSDRKQKKVFNETYRSKKFEEETPENEVIGNSGYAESNKSAKKRGGRKENRKNSQEERSENNKAESINKSYPEKSNKYDDQKIKNRSIDNHNVNLNDTEKKKTDKSHNKEKYDDQVGYSKERKNYEKCSNEKDMVIDKSTDYTRSNKDRDQIANDGNIDKSNGKNKNKKGNKRNNSNRSYDSENDYYKDNNSFQDSTHSKTNSNSNNKSTKPQKPKIVDRFKDKSQTGGYEDDSFQKPNPPKGFKPTDKKDSNVKINFDVINDKKNFYSEKNSNERFKSDQSIVNKREISVPELAEKVSSIFLEERSLLPKDEIDNYDGKTLVISRQTSFSKKENDPRTGRSNKHKSQPKFIEDAKSLAIPKEISNKEYQGSLSSSFDNSTDSAMSNLESQTSSKESKDFKTNESKKKPNKAKSYSDNRKNRKQKNYSNDPNVTEEEYNASHSLKENRIKDKYEEDSKRVLHQKDDLNTLQENKTSNVSVRSKSRGSRSVANKQDSLNNATSFDKYALELQSKPFDHDMPGYKDIKSMEITNSGIGYEKYKKWDKTFDERINERGSHDRGSLTWGDSKCSPKFRAKNNESSSSFIQENVTRGGLIQLGSTNTSSRNVDSNPSPGVQKLLYNPDNPSKPVAIVPSSRDIPSGWDNLQDCREASNSPIDPQISGNETPAEHNGRIDPAVLYNIQKGEMDIAYYVGSNQLPREFPRIMDIRMHLQKCYHSLLTSDIRFCQEKNIEISLWKTLYYSIIEKLREYISHEPGLKDRSLATLQMLVDEGQNYLQDLLNSLQLCYKFSLENHLEDDSQNQSNTRNRIRLALMSSQKLLLYLGDLARYKEQYSSNPNYNQAKK